MLSEAIDQILREHEHDRARRELREAHRQQMRALDHWLHAVEEVLLKERHTVSEPIFWEIGTFLRQHLPALHCELQRNRSRDAAAVLEVLFEAQGVLQCRSRPAERKG